MTMQGLIRAKAMINGELKKLSKELERDAAEIDAITQIILDKYERDVDNQQPYLANCVIRTGIDLANAELRTLYFRAKHIRARYLLAVGTRKNIDKARYQRLLTSLEEKVGIIENLMKKGELYGKS